MSGVSVGFASAGSEEEAVRIARALVEERLVACATIALGVRSIYRWEGAVEEDSEALLVLKTRTDRTEAAARRIAELHSYDTPETVWVDASGGNAAYLEWVAASVSG